MWAGCDRDMEETEGGWPINSVIPRGDNLTFSRSENIHLSLALLNYLKEVLRREIQGLKVLPVYRY